MHFRWTLPKRTLVVGALLGLLAACSTTDVSRSPAEYATDADVTARARLALLAHPQLSQADLQVRTLGGTVEVRGELPEDASPEDLHGLLSGVEGVSNINYSRR